MEGTQILTICHTSGVCRGRYGVHGARWFSGGLWPPSIWRSWAWELLWRFHEGAFSMLNFKHLLSDLKEVELMPKKDWRRRRIKVTIQWSLMCQDGLNRRSLATASSFVRLSRKQCKGCPSTRISPGLCFWSEVYSRGLVGDIGATLEICDEEAQVILKEASIGVSPEASSHWLLQGMSPLLREGVSQVFRLQKASIVAGRGAQLSQLEVCEDLVSCWREGRIVVGKVRSQFSFLTCVSGRAHDRDMDARERLHVILGVSSPRALIRMMNHGFHSANLAQEITCCTFRSLAGTVTDHVLLSPSLLPALLSHHVMLAAPFPDVDATLKEFQDIGWKKPTKDEMKQLGASTSISNAKLLFTVPQSSIAKGSWQDLWRDARAMEEDHSNRH